MSDTGGFVINDGVLEKYTGKGGDVVIPDGVTAIGEGAFYNRESVFSVTLSEGVTKIGAWAFFRCKGLKTITLPNSITHIGEKTFAHCTTLTSIALPDGITDIAESTFEGCKNLESVSIPENVINIAPHAFSGCTKLSFVEIPDSVTNIGRSAFSDCKALADKNGFVVVKGILCGYYGSDDNIIIPEGVTIIDNWVLAYHSKISTLALPDSLERIEIGAFKSTKIENLILPENITKYENSALEVILNYFFGTEQKKLVICSFLRQVPFCVLTNADVRRKLKTNKNKIVENAINNDDAEIISKLFDLYESIDLDDLNEYIEKANSATGVKLYLLDYKNKKYPYEKQVEHEKEKLEKELGLKKRTVAEWRKIYNFETEDNQVTITGYKGKDTKVIIPETIGKYKVGGIGDFAFSPEAFRLKKELKETRSKLQSIYIPDTVNRFGKGVFYRCEGLADKDGLVIICGVLYSFHGSCNIVKIPDGVTAIDDNAFCKGRQLIRITLPDSVSNIGENVFSRFKRLTIYAPVGSYAEKYAEKNKINFVAEKTEY